MLRARGTSIVHTTEVLAGDGGPRRRPAHHLRAAGWRASSTALPPASARRPQRWARTLRDGGPRARARDQTPSGYLQRRPPGAAGMVGRYDHLREVTRDDVLAHAETLHGHHRHTTLVALRSLFGWAKKNGVIFRNPTSRIRVGRRDWPVWQPLLPERDRPDRRGRHHPAGPARASRWPPCTPPDAARSANCSSTTSTSATAG